MVLFFGVGYIFNFVFISFLFISICILGRGLLIELGCELFLGFFGNVSIFCEEKLFIFKI